ncbi:MAG: hypothetical protein KGK07_17520, partial [Chloroflexota bacterium]|nr:hypothetical protein [Chloroflexota bacterium]
MNVAPAPWRHRPIARRRTLGGVPTSVSGLTIPSIPTSVPVSVPGGYYDPSGLLAQQLQQQGLVPTDPNVAGYIASIQQAAIAEGLPANGQDVVSRVQTFATAYQQMYNNPSVASVGNAVQISLNAARQYVTQNHELAGAISTAQGLVTAFEQAASGGGTPQDVAAAFTGPLIAAAVAAGAVSAGVGAVIVAGVSIAASILDQVGLFASKPGIQVCPTFKYTGSGMPSFSVNCMAVFDQTGGPISPGSANWRSFPQASDPSVAWWFQGMPSGGTFQEWKQAMWIPRPNGGGFPIIEAFSNWMWI